MTEICIITVAAGGCSGLLDTVRSVDSQSIPPVRHILVVSRVPQSQLDEIEARPYRRIVQDKDNSLYNAMNIGLSTAVGDLVVFLNGGDVLYDTRTIRYIIRKWDGESIFCGRSIQSFEGDIYMRPRLGHLAELGWSTPHQSFYAPLKKPLPLYDESGKIGADSAWMNKVREIYPSQFASGILSHFALGGISNSPSFKTIRLRWRHDGSRPAIKEVLKLSLHAMFGHVYAYRICYSRRYSHSRKS